MQLVCSVRAVVRSVADGVVAQIRAGGTMQRSWLIPAGWKSDLSAAARDRAEVPGRLQFFAASHHVVSLEVVAAAFVRPFGAFAHAVAAPPGRNARAVFAVSDVSALKNEEQIELLAHGLVHAGAVPLRCQGIEGAIARLEARQGAELEPGAPVLLVP